jgi:hypothetical protein
MRMRTATALCAALALVGTTAHAEPVDIGKKSASEIKDFCGKVAGGKFTQSPDGNSYGCAAECTGGTCHVQCDKDTGCDVSIPGERRVPTGRDPRYDAFVNLSPALQTSGDHGGRAFPIGLIGLLGLAGLLGLRRNT